jgi:DNA-binding CsgD family transcriptional regulator
LAARCRALLGPESDTARAHFQEALQLHERSNRPWDRARTHLLFGEHLRRDRRRVDARQHLRLSAEGFEELGALPWLARARSELRATGETSRRRDDSSPPQLTPQEYQIVGLVTTGSSNRDVAAQLFLSPRTVEYHLSKVYAKVGVSSRSELAGLALGAGALG